MLHPQHNSDLFLRRILRVISICAVAGLILLLFMHGAKAAMPPTNPSMLPIWTAVQNSQMTAALLLRKDAISKKPVTEKKEYVAYHLVYANTGDNRIYHLDTFEDEEACFSAAKSNEYRDFVFEQFGDDDPKLFCQSSRRQVTD